MWTWRSHSVVIVIQTHPEPGTALVRVLPPCPEGGRNLPSSTACCRGPWLSTSGGCHKHPQGSQEKSLGERNLSLSDFFPIELFPSFCTMQSLIFFLDGDPSLRTPLYQALRAANKLSKAARYRSHPPTATKDRAQDDTQATIVMKR